MLEEFHFQNCEGRQALEQGHEVYNNCLYSNFILARNKSVREFKFFMERMRVSLTK